MFLTFREACRSWTSCLSSVMSSLQVHRREQTASFTSPTGDNQHLPINVIAFSSTLKTLKALCMKAFIKIILFLKHINENNSHKNNQIIVKCLDQK